MPKRLKKLTNATKYVEEEYFSWFDNRELEIKVVILSVNQVMNSLTFQRFALLT